MANKIVAPPGTPDELIGICKALLGKTGKRAFIWNGFTALIFPKKKLAIILLAQFASRYFKQMSRIGKQLDFSAPFQTYLGEPRIHEVSDLPLPEELDDTYRLFGSKAKGEPHLKSEGFNTFLSGLNDPVWKSYFNQVYKYLRDVDRWQREGEGNYDEWFALHGDHLVEELGEEFLYDPVHGYYSNTPIWPIYDTLTNENIVEDIIRRHFAAFDIYEYITTYFPENSICDALLDAVGQEYYAFPTYNGAPIYRGPAQTYAMESGSPPWLTLIPMMCRKTPSGEYIIIFRQELMSKLGENDQSPNGDKREKITSASTVHLTNAEFQALNEDNFYGDAFRSIYDKSNVMQWYWVAYKASDVLNNNDLSQTDFTLNYDNDNSSSDYGEGNERTLTFSFDSTVPGQDFNIRYALPAAARLGLVQEDDILLNALELYSYGAYQRYWEKNEDEVNPPYDGTPASGVYHPYDRLPQHVDYLPRSIFLQVIEANMTNTPIDGGFILSGTLVFDEYVYPVGATAESLAYWVDYLDSEQYLVYAKGLRYWEPYKFYDLGQYIGVGSKLDGMVSPFGLQGNDYGAQGFDKWIKNVEIETIVTQPAVISDYRLPWNYFTTTENTTWRHLQMSHQYKNRELTFLTQIVVCRNVVQNDYYKGEEPSNFKYDATTIITRTKTKTVHDRVYKTFDIVGEDLVVTNGDEVSYNISLGSYSGWGLASGTDFEPSTWSNVSASQGDLEMGAVTYDIEYQEYPGAPKQLGARVNIPNSYIRPTQWGGFSLPATAEDSLDWLHSLEAVWPFKCDPVQITEGVFLNPGANNLGCWSDYKDTAFPDGLTAEPLTPANNSFFVNIAGHTLQVKGGDFYLDGVFLFRPVQSLFDADVASGEITDQWDYTGAVEAVTGGFVGQVFDPTSAGEDGNIYIWGDSDTSTQTYSYTYEDHRSRTTFSPSYFEVIESSNGWNITERIPKQLLVHAGNNLHTGQTLAFCNYMSRLAGNSEFSYNFTDYIFGYMNSDMRFYDPYNKTIGAYSGGSNPTDVFDRVYSTSGRNTGEVQSADELLSAVGTHVAHGWEQFEDGLRLGYARVRIGEDGLPDSGNNDPVEIDTHISAWLDVNTQELKLCFYCEATETGSRTGDYIPAHIAYNDFMTPNAIPIAWPGPSEPADGFTTPRPEELITQEGFEDAALSGGFSQFNQTDVLSPNLDHFIVNEKPEDEDA